MFAEEGIVHEFWLIVDLMEQDLPLDGLEVLGAVFGCSILRDLTQQELVVADHLLANFVTRLGLSSHDYV